MNVTELDTGLEVGHVSLSTNFTLFALHPYYSYSIRVTAVTVAAGPAASPVVIRTNEDGKLHVIIITALASLYVSLEEK